MAAQSSAPATDLKLSVDNSPTGSVVHCSGKITASTTNSLLDQVHHLIPQSKHIVLDLAQVSYIDSSGLGAIVRLWSSAQKSGCAYKITNLQPRIKELLSMTNLSSIFEG